MPKINTSPIDDLFDSSLPFYQRAEELRYTNGSPAFTDFLEKAYGVTVSKIWVMGWGYSNLNFLLTTNRGKYLVRASQNPKSAEDLEFELKVKLFLSQKGLAVRKPIPTIDGQYYLHSPKGRVLQALVFLEGYSPEIYTLKHVRSSGELLARFHQASLELPKSVSAETFAKRKVLISSIYDLVKRSFTQDYLSVNKEDLDRISWEKHQPLLEQSLIAVGKSISSIDGDPSSSSYFIHNDYTPLNVVFKGQTAVGVIDFERSGFGPRLWDVGKGAAQWIIHADKLDQKALVKRFSSGYADVWGADVSNNRVLTDFIILGVSERLGAAITHYHDYQDKIYWQEQVCYFLSRLLALV